MCFLWFWEIYKSLVLWLSFCSSCLESSSVYYSSYKCCYATRPARESERGKSIVSARFTTYSKTCLPLFTLTVRFVDFFGTSTASCWVMTSGTGSMQGPLVGGTVRACLGHLPSLERWKPLPVAYIPLWNPRSRSGENIWGPLSRLLRPSLPSSASGEQRDWMRSRTGCAQARWLPSGGAARAHFGEWRRHVGRADGRGGGREEALQEQVPEEGGGASVSPSRCAASKYVSPTSSLAHHVRLRLQPSLFLWRWAMAGGRGWQERRTPARMTSHPGHGHGVASLPHTPPRLEHIAISPREQSLIFPRPIWMHTTAGLLFFLGCYFLTDWDLGYFLELCILQSCCFNLLRLLLTGSDLLGETQEGEKQPEIAAVIAVISAPLSLSILTIAEHM